MRVTFYGAAGEVTGSRHLIESDNYRILLDCGIHQGHRAESNARNAELPFDAQSVTNVLLSHAHIDHSGSLPTLVKKGYRGDIICTDATRDLTGLMLRDMGKIQEQDAAYWNKKHSRNGTERIDPIYTILDAERAMRQFVTHDYEMPFRLLDTRDSSVKVTLYDAGHILGSATTVLEFAERGSTLRIAFTGDLGRPDALILRDPHPAEPVDYLITEATYGNRTHESPRDSEDHLVEVVRETAKHDGKIVIPSFAVERTQEIVYLLHTLTISHRIPEVPIFVDSPLAIDATEVYRMHPEDFDQDTIKFMDRYDDPWGFRRLIYTRDVEESKKINGVKGAAIIISANGMVEAGRILHHVKNNITDPKNTLLFVSYQAEGTLGRRLLDGAKEARIFGENFPVRARIEKAEGFSGHADHDQLLNWVRPISKGLKGVFVVHAEPDSAEAMRVSLDSLGIGRVWVPKRGETFELN